MLEEFCSDTTAKNGYIDRYKEITPQYIILSSTKARDLIEKASSGRIPKDYVIDPVMKNEFESKRQESIAKQELKYREMFVQKIDPLHYKKMERMYREAVSSDNIELRDLIIDEFFKYDGEKVTDFFKKKNNVRENFMLKYRIVRHLLLLQHYAKLTPKVKGKKQKTERVSGTRKYDPSVELMADVAQRIRDKDPFELCKRYDVFISHRKQDFDHAWKEVVRLNKEGKTCYFCWRSDEKSGFLPKSEMEEILKLRIAQSNAFLIIESENYESSEWCMFEKSIAKEMQKQIITIKV